MISLDSFVHFFARPVASHKAYPLGGEAPPQAVVGGISRGFEKK